MSLVVGTLQLNMNFMLKGKVLNPLFTLIRKAVYWRRGRMKA